MSFQGHPPLAGGPLGRECPKCAYRRKVEDEETPAWQCPSCGIAYDKFRPCSKVTETETGSNLSADNFNLKSSNSPNPLLVVFGALVLVAGLIMAWPSPKQVSISELFPDSDAGVVVLVTDWCPYCQDALEYLNRKNISYTAYDIETDPRGRNAFDALEGRGTPLILVGDQSVTGWDQNWLERMLINEGLL